MKKIIFCLIIISLLLFGCSADVTNLDTQDDDSAPDPGNEGNKDKDIYPTPPSFPEG